MESPRFVTAYLAFAYGAAGDRASATLELAELEKISKDGTVLPFNVALVYVGLDDHAYARQPGAGPRGRFADDGVNRVGMPSSIPSAPSRGSWRS
jgi:hypothetical protein